MKVMGAAIVGLTLVAPLAIATPPAQAQDVMGQVQRFFNPNGDQQAYERGREDQWRQQQAERAQRQAQRDRSREEQGYSDRGYYDNGPTYSQRDGSNGRDYNYNQPYYNGR